MANPIKKRMSYAAIRKTNCEYNENPILYKKYKLNKKSANPSYLVPVHYFFVAMKRP